MKYAIAVVACCLLFSGCADTAQHDFSEPTLAPSFYSRVDNETAEFLAGIDLCDEYADAFHARYPENRLELNADALAHYRSVIHSSTKSMDIAYLRSDISLMITHLRQSAYLCIETWRKSGDALPDGMLEFVEDWDARFAQSGW